MNNPDLNWLLSFSFVVESGSYASAALRSGIAANTLSRQIQSLEGYLGVRLIHRSTRQLVVTSAGWKLYERCGHATSILSDAKQAVSEFVSTPAGLVRVAVPAAFFEYFKPQWVSEFLQKHEGISLEFLLGDNHVDLIANRIDLAIRAGRLVDSQLVARRLVNSHQILVTSPSYLLMRGLPIEAAELSLHSCIVHTAIGNKWILVSKEAVMEVKVESRFSVDNMTAGCQAALSGLGIALVPVSIATKYVTNGELVRVLPNCWRDGGSVYALFPERKHVPLAVSVFAEFVAERIRLMEMSAADSLPTATELKVSLDRPR